MTGNIRVPALERALRILEVLQKNRRCTISELINLTSLPRSSVYVLVDDMIKLRLIRQNSDKTVQLWMKLVSLGNSASEGLDLKEIITPFLEKLIENVDCLVAHFGIMDDEKAFYVVKRTSHLTGMRVLSREGSEVSLVHSALGKCLLAYQESTLREKLITTLDYTLATANSIATPQALRKELASIHNRGFAYDNGEGSLEIRCVAVPVFDLDSHLMGAISVSGTITKFSSDKLSGIVDKVKKSAIQISSSLMI
ncbi:MAG: IclR family transcriptional regulator [Aeromonadales bacterium]|nr:IclR family transcriptional regulator [Aeromonadales bacterium]